METLAQPRLKTHSDRFRAMIHSITGISLPPSKVPMIDQRLRRRVLALGLPDTETYLEQLLDGQGMEAELRQVIDLITTNTTSFFREVDHFRVLENLILPARLAKSRRSTRPRIKVWSAAASEGAEAYSAAMVLADAQRKGAQFDFAVLGTDISQRMIERAKAGIYGADQVASVPQELQLRYVMASDHPSVAGKARIAPELRRHVRFRLLNLMEPAYPLPSDIDVIFLRNVLIYFDATDKTAVIDRLVRHLAIGGYLLVGHSESMAVRHDGLRQVRPTIFERI